MTEDGFDYERLFLRVRFYLNLI